MQKFTGKASQECMLSKLFVSELQARMLFKSFVASLLMYCLPVLLHEHICQRHKIVKKVFHGARSLGIDVGDLDTIARQTTKSIMMCCSADENHFIRCTIFANDAPHVIHVKYQSPQGKGCFLRQMCIMLNEILFLNASSILYYQAPFLTKYMHPFLATIGVLATYNVCDRQINQSINRSINQSISESVSQSINQSRHCKQDG